MTVHEAKLIQTFPANYKIVGSWGEAMRQIGNAVPVRLAEKMGQQMMVALEQVHLATKKMYKAAEKGKGAKKVVAKAKTKRNAKAGRLKSVKARYAKHGAVKGRRK